MSAEWLRTVQNELLFAPNIRKIRVAGRQLIIDHTAGPETQYTYENTADAQSAFNDISAVVASETVGEPAITLVNPAAMNDSGFPITLAVSGIAFDATAQIILQNYSSTLTLVTTFVNSTALTAPVAAGGVGTYDVVYSDNNGKVFRAANALVIF